MCGFTETSLKIKKIDSKQSDKLIVHLSDGKTWEIPIQCFPKIMRLPVKKRKIYIIQSPYDLSMDKVYFHLDYDILNVDYSIMDLIFAHEGKIIEIPYPIQENYNTIK